MRLWRNTAAANLTGTQTLTLAPDTLGYEWDVDADNGFRPAGQIHLSSTTVSGLEVFTDYGSTTEQGGTATHNLTMYKRVQRRDRVRRRHRAVVVGPRRRRTRTTTRPTATCSRRR